MTSHPDHTDPVANAFDRLAAGYDTTYSDEVSFAEDRRVVSLLRPEIKHARDVLDAACGTGWVLDQFPDLFGPRSSRRYYGFDISEGMLKRLVEKHPQQKHIWHGDINDPNVFGKPDDRYDLIVSTFCSPSYVEDPGEWLRRAAQHLHPGGRVFLMPHARGNDQRLPYLEIDDAYINDKPWGERSTFLAMQAAGFQDIEISGLRHPGVGPNEKRGRLAHDLWLKVEPHLFRPDALCFLIVTGTVK